MKMPVKGREVECLWSAPDGTECRIVTSATPPMYIVTLVRGHVVLRERRLYGRASAHMVAQSWTETLDSAL